MTEFALVLPVFALLLFGILQLGVTFKNYLTLTEAARDGARKGAVARHLSGDPVANTTAEVRRAATGFDPSKLEITVSSTWEKDSQVRVTAKYPYEISLMGLVVKSGDLTSSATDRVE
jgi:Flp pilus assembly protein TadG